MFKKQKKATNPSEKEAPELILASTVTNDMKRDSRRAPIVSDPLTLEPALAGSQGSMEIIETRKLPLTAPLTQVQEDDLRHTHDLLVGLKRAWNHPKDIDETCKLALVTIKVLKARRDFMGYPSEAPKQFKHETNFNPYEVKQISRNIPQSEDE